MLLLHWTQSGVQDQAAQGRKMEGVKGEEDPQCCFKTLFQSLLIMSALIPKQGIQG